MVSQPDNKHYKNKDKETKSLVDHGVKELRESDSLGGPCLPKPK